ncbi:hypothetical protein [Marinococcus luteus]|uniref:hypothetical protein n=1 Tax=Marinococcus luteus TaxID=1122204 RepID=UPI002ACD6697|nr:hypothetical protein [Marinococcus luteus]
MVLKVLISFHQHIITPATGKIKKLVLKKNKYLTFCADGLRLGCAILRAGIARKPK